MFGRKYLSPIIFLSMTFSLELLADTKRMENVALRLGIDREASSSESLEAKAAVDKLVGMGLTAYPTLKEREADLASKKMSQESAEASYGPTLSINALANRRDEKDEGTEVKSHSDGHGANLILRQNLYRGGRDSGQIEINKQDVIVAENNQGFEIENVSFAIRRAALEYNFRSLRQLIDEASFADASDLRALAQRKLDAGQVGKIDLYTTSMRESTAKAAAARSAIEANQAETRLLHLLGPRTNYNEIKGEMEKLSTRALPYPERSPLFADTNVKTFEEKNAEALAKRADLALSQGYRERFLPTLDLVGQLSKNKNNSYYNSDAVGDTRVNSSGTLVQLELNWMLWDRRLDYQNKALREERVLAEAQANTAHYRVATEAERIKRYVAELFNNLGTTIEAYKASGQLYDAQIRLYESGVVGIQPLIDAEREKRLAIADWQENVYQLQLNLLIWDALQKGFLPSSGSGLE